MSTKYCASYTFVVVTVNCECKPEQRETVFNTFEDLLAWYRTNKDSIDPIFGEPYVKDIDVFKLNPEEIPISCLDALL
jgi:hypothetical protein